MTKCIPIPENTFSSQVVLDDVSKGLAPVISYEPWFPRSLESIKESINDGIPVLVRLHSAASYPSSERYLIDLEGHSVLIIGYDDDKQSVEVVDPWNTEWGGVHSGKRWISYSTLQVMVVNATCNKTQNLAPLQINVNQKNLDGELSLDLEVGFYCPRGTIMDRSSWVITSIIVDCDPPKTWQSESKKYVIDGRWHVGEFLNLSFPIQNSVICEGEIQLNVKAIIEGNRPYKFNDQIEVHRTVKINSSLANPSNVLVQSHIAVG